MHKYFLIFLSLFLFSSCCLFEDHITYEDTSVYLGISNVRDAIPVIVGRDNIDYNINEYNVFSNIGGLRPVFRIPCVSLTNKGTLLVACENREDIDDRGEIDILIARKQENEDSFEVRRVYEYDSRLGRSMNPVFLVDKKTGRIFLFYCHFLDNLKYGREHSTEEIDFVYKYSDDDGCSWSDEVSIKHLWNVKAYTAAIPSSVKGISMLNGIMLLPIIFIKDRATYSGLLIISDGHCEFSCLTPNMGDSECTVFLDNNNTIFLDCRTMDNTRRRYCYSINKDEFVETDSSSLDYDVEVSTEIVNDGGLFYMCFPDSPRNRRDNITLFGSKDGTNWMKLYRMMDGYAHFGYSSIAVSANQMFTCFETEKGIFVQNVGCLEQAFIQELEY